MLKGKINLVFVCSKSTFIKFRKQLSSKRRLANTGRADNGHDRQTIPSELRQYPVSQRSLKCRIRTNVRIGRRPAIEHFGDIGIAQSNLRYVVNNTNKGNR